ncbi:MAG: YchJ family protein [Ghiorsea sp.]|nr:YchJ family protein [Ghiorsea sp.]
MTTKHTLTCPCKSGKTLDNCCKPYHDNTIDAPTAEVLMRSRYSAFVLGLSDYIWRTWHETTRPDLEILGGLGLKWIDLKIISSEVESNTDDTDTIHFIASFVSGHKGKTLDEVSSFVKEGGLWYYVDGISSTAIISRNDTCPCGSSIKFKRCCLR